MLNKKFLGTLPLAILLALSGCGGGGGGGSASVAPGGGGGVVLLPPTSHASGADKAANSKPNIGSIVQSSNTDDDDKSTDSIAITPQESSGRVYWSVTKTPAEGGAKALIISGQTAVGQNFRLFRDTMTGEHRAEIENPASKRLHWTWSDFQGIGWERNVMARYYDADNPLTPLSGARREKISDFAIDIIAKGDPDGDWMAGGFWYSRVWTAAENDWEFTEFGVFADGKDYASSSSFTELATSGGATYRGKSYGYISPVGDGFPTLGEFSADVEINVDFRPAFSHEMSGRIYNLKSYEGSGSFSATTGPTISEEPIAGLEFRIATTEWDRGADNAGEFAFIGGNVITPSCRGDYSACGAGGSQIGATFTGSDSGGGVPTNIVGTYGINDLEAMWRGETARADIVGFFGATRRQPAVAADNAASSEGVRSPPSEDLSTKAAKSLPKFGSVVQSSNTDGAGKSTDGVEIAITGANGDEIAMEKTGAGANDFAIGNQDEKFSPVDLEGNIIHWAFDDFAGRGWDRNLLANIKFKFSGGDISSKANLADIFTKFDAANPEDWMAGGYWLSFDVAVNDENEAELIVEEYGVFADGEDWDYDNNPLPIAGGATYRGDAYGYYNNLAGDLAGIPTGEFSADVEMNVEFAPANAHSMSGKIDGIKLHGIDEDADFDYAAGPEADDFVTIPLNGLEFDIAETFWDDAEKGFVGEDVVAPTCGGDFSACGDGGGQFGATFAGSDSGEGVPNNLIGTFGVDDFEYTKDGEAARGDILGVFGASKE